MKQISANKISSHLKYYYNRLIVDKYQIARMWLIYLLRYPKRGKWNNYRHWLKTLTDRVIPVTDPVPWITYEAISWMKSHLNENMKLYEWGSGLSTLFFYKRVGEIVSVEHNKKWYEFVKKHLVKNGFSKCRYILSLPTSPKKSKKRSSSYSMYVNTINKYPDGYFDLIMIDGRSRNECVKLAIKKVKYNGYIVLDNAERKEYAPSIELFKRNNFKRISFFGPGPINSYAWDTSIFSKEI